ncbi:hypothetical protein CAPTEDRAFT_223828 [Capitella teleta]|uniref:U3 small nucleolar RNA-associated protein 18 homolog n=1 Tax=Capitella teleta TaxID=283909 RepID=R7TR57_CAPTE|nr:hypothetical protein CAPTEDRAFT_223828 [Capitella teleta]|eukprot:ELT96062.1 hypothetical protein CAPTEDRAFT_223828 [Capitella teleta]
MLRRAAKREKELSEKTSRVKRIKPEEDDSEARALGEKDTSAIEALRELEKSVLGDDQDIIEELTKSKETKVKVEAPPCAWVDEEQDDAGIINVPRVIPSRLKVSGKINKDTYQSKLKDEFSKVTGNPSWAKLDWEKDESEKKDDPDSDTEGLLTSTGDYIASSALLPRGLIQMRSCADANKQYTSQGRLNASEFHPSAQVLLAAGMDQRLNLFQIDGKHNPKIQSIFLQNYPVHSAHFTADGQQVVAGSKFRSFYYYDMMAGKVVNVPWIKALEENQMRRFEVSPDGRFLAFYGMYGRIHLLSSQSTHGFLRSRLIVNGLTTPFTN